MYLLIKYISFCFHSNYTYFKNLKVKKEKKMYELLICQTLGKVTLKNIRYRVLVFELDFFFFFK